MTSVGAFNDMLEQFMVELMQTFPEEGTIKKYHAAFDVMRKSNPRKCVEGFMTGMAPYSEKIMNRDESILDDGIDIIKELSIKKHWDTDTSDNTKNAIWQYIQTLYMLGTTITAIPSDTLSMIEGIAKDCADKMQNGDGQIDQDALMKMMGGMLGNLPKK